MPGELHRQKLIRIRVSDASRKRGNGQQFSLMA